jgi:hypothetical protein
MAQCVALWGEPVAVSDGAGGARSVVFSNATVHVEAGLVDGVVTRLVYRGLQMEYRDIPEILAANAAEQTWHRWSPPRATGSADGRRQWMRSDEMAMAFYEHDTMTVIGSDWNRAQLVAVAETPEGLSAMAVATPTNTPVEPAPAAPPAIAEVKTPRPDTVPVIGDSRVTAIRILGPPPGSLRNGSREILSYPWGSVCLTDGRVVSIK